MHDDDSDSLLDAQLADVALPEGLLERLRAACAANRVWSDDEIDAELTRVAVPGNLAARCRNVLADAPLDAALLEVPVPEGLLLALRDIARETRPATVPRRAPSKLSRRLTSLALAASFTLLIGGGYLAALSAWLGGLRSPRQEPMTLAVEYLGPLEITAEPGPAVGISPFQEVPRESNEPEVAPEQFVSWDDPSEADLPSPPSGAAGTLMAAFQADLDPLRDMLLLRYGALGSPVRDEPRAEFVAVDLGQARGLEPPAVRGFDRRFLLRQGVHPVVAPSAHELLRTSRVPLSTDTLAFERTRQKLAEGRWPHPSEVRVEDFLAAIDYQFPTPPSAHLGLHVSAGPSPFGQPLANIPQAALLHVGVQAGRAPFRRLPATHLVVGLDGGLDGSSAMQGSGRFDMARRAITRLAAELGPRDRLSLVVFRDDGVDAIEAVSRERVGELLLALERMQPRGGGNFGAGLQSALSLALRNELDERISQQVVVLAPSDASLAGPALDRLRELAAEAARQDVGLTFVELHPTATSDATLALLATAGQGTVRRAGTFDELRFALLETLTGSNTLVAADATLQVTFNPRTVAGYRLLGHEANALASAAPVRVEADLRSGQTATALYEVWLVPGGGSEIATVEVAWRDPHSSEKRFERQAVSRGEFASSFAEAPFALQQAALAAETAEVLRDSYFVQGKPRSVEHVVEVSKTAAYDLSKRSDFRRYVSFLKDLDKARHKRSD